MPKILVGALALLLGVALGPLAAPATAAPTAGTTHAAGRVDPAVAPDLQPIAQRAGVRGAKRFVAKWYSVANKRQWKRLKGLSRPGVVKSLRGTIRFAKSYHGIDLLPFGRRIACYDYDGVRFECYSDRDDPVGVVVEKRRAGWRAAWVNFYD